MLKCLLIDSSTFYLTNKVLNLRDYFHKIYYEKKALTSVVLFQFCQYFLNAENEIEQRICDGMNEEFI